MTKGGIGEQETPQVPGAVPGPRGEVLISGLDTGPTADQRENLSPTEDRLRFQPTHPVSEPTDEDG